MMFDRTAQDAENAKALREKISNDEILTDEELEMIERGTCTYNTLNAIEFKQAELQLSLNIYGYIVNIINKGWDEKKKFRGQDHRRVLENLDKLKDAFFVYDTTPSTPIYMFNWQNLNAIEKILYDIEQMIGDMTRNFKECGTFECGGNI